CSARRGGPRPRDVPGTARVERKPIATRNRSAMNRSVVDRCGLWGAANLPGNAKSHTPGKRPGSPPRPRPGRSGDAPAPICQPPDPTTRRPDAWLRGFVPTLPPRSPRDFDFAPLSPTNRMLQVCNNTNAPPENGPDFSSQVSAGLVLNNPEIFSKSCGAGWRSGKNGWFVTIMMGPCSPEGGRIPPRKRGSGT